MILESSRAFRWTAKLATFLAGAGLVWVAAASTEPEPPEQAWSAQLHVHGSFSEGVGSMDSHTFEAARLGVDVVWWSDHDYRITAARSVARFGFEGPRRPLSESVSWRPMVRREELATVRLVEAPDARHPDAEATFVPRACEGQLSLRVSLGSEGDEFAYHLLALEANGYLETRPLAGGVTLHVSLSPDRTGPDGSAVIAVDLSEHPVEGELRLHRVLYVIGAQGAPRRDGETLVIPLPGRAREWNHYRLPVSEQVIDGFPELVGEDNSLHRLSVGVRARRGAKATARFDDLRIEQELGCDEAFAAQARVMGAVAERRPGVRQHQGVEVSYYGPHLNEFSAGTDLIDLDALIADSGLEGGDAAERARIQSLYTRTAVERAHARKGLISLNHFFGAGRREQKQPEQKEAALERLVAEELYGADLLEVGYRDRGGHSLADHLWVWDRLPREGLFPVGLGVSDSHGGPDGRWAGAANNFVSWIWAPTLERADLIAGLRAGRVFFGDVTLFDGTIDMETDGGARMGSVVVGAGDEAVIRVSVTGLAPGEVVDLIVDGERAHGWTAESDGLTAERRVALSGAATVVRLEVSSEEHGVEALSNPIVFADAALGAGVDPVRLRR